MAKRELTYVRPTDSRLRTLLVSMAEDLAGRRKLLPLYARWREHVARSPETMMSFMLKLIEVTLEVRAGPDWPLKVHDDEPVVLIANHPYGISDGIIALTLAEQLSRPYRVLINKDLLNVPEIADCSLPIDFSQTKEAVAMNLKSRNEARKLLTEGVTIVVFPAGGVATAANPFGRAEELMWGSFAARLIQQTKASVLPVYFEGQPGPMFHLASRLSQSLRMLFMVLEFKNFPGRTFTGHVGRLTKHDEIAGNGNRQSLTDELYLMVQRLSPEASGVDDALLRPTPPDERPVYPWDSGGFY